MQMIRCQQVQATTATTTATATTTTVSTAIATGEHDIDAVGSCELQEIDMLSDKMTGLTNCRLFSFGIDVCKYLYNALWRMVPSLRRHLFNGEENEFSG